MEDHQMRPLLALSAVCALFALPAHAENGAPFLRPPNVEARPRDALPDTQDPALPDMAPEQGLEKRLKRLLELLRTGDAHARANAVAELETVDDHRASEALWAGVRRLSGPLKRRCASALALLASDFPRSRIGADIASYLDQARKCLRANTDPGVASHFLDYLFMRDRARALEHARAFLPMLGSPPGLFDLLLRHSGKDTLSALARFATERGRRKTGLRTGSVRALGRWGNGPPLMSVRVPALLSCLRDPDTARDAENSLRAVSFARPRSPGAWARWWKGRAGKDDAEIAWADLSDALRASEEELPETLRNIEDWIGDWKDPRFRWAVPVLHRLLGDSRAKPLRSGIVSALSGVGDPSSLPELERLEATLDPTREKSILVQIINGSARLAQNAGIDARTATAHRLMAHLDSIHPRVVQGACKAMGTLGFRPAEEKLVAILNRPGRGVTAAFGAEALGAMGAKSRLGEILDALAGALQGTRFEDGVLARGAIKAVGALDVRSPEAVNLLLASIGAEDERTVLEASRVLGESWRHAEAEKPLARLFDDETLSHPVRLKALEILALYSPGLATETLIRATGLKLCRHLRTNYEFFRVARTRLSQPGSVLPEHRPQLLGVVSSETASTAGRALCLKLVGREEIWEEKTALEPVLTALDADVDVAEAAMKVLTAHPTRRAMDRIIDALPDLWGNPPSIQNDWKVYLLRTYRELLPPELRPPDFGRNKKGWRRWFDRKGHLLRF